MRVGLCPGIGLEGWLRWFVHLFVLSRAGGHVQYLAFAPYSSFFAPDSSEIAVGCILSLYLLVQNLSQLHMHIAIIQFSSVQFRHSVVSNSLRPHELQHARPPCPSPTPGVHSDSRPVQFLCIFCLRRGVPTCKLCTRATKDRRSQPGLSQYTL